MKRGRPKVDHKANFRKAIQTDIQRLLKLFFLQKYLSFPHFAKCWEQLQFSAIHTVERGKVDYGQYLQCLYFEIFLCFCHEPFWNQFSVSENLLLSQISDPKLRMLIGHVCLFYLLYMIHMTQIPPSTSITASYTSIEDAGRRFVPIRINELFLQLFQFHLDYFTALQELYPAYQFLGDVKQILSYLFDNNVFIVSSSIGPIVINCNPKSTDHQWNYLKEERLQPLIQQFQDTMKNRLISNSLSTVTGNSSSNDSQQDRILSVVAAVFEVHPSPEDLQVIEAETQATSSSSMISTIPMEVDSSEALTVNVTTDPVTSSIASRRAAYFRKRQEKQLKLQQRLQEKIEKLRKKIYRHLPSSSTIPSSSSSSSASFSRSHTILPREVTNNLEAMMTDLSSIIINTNTSKPALEPTITQKIRVDSSGLPASNINNTNRRGKIREAMIPVESEEHIAFLEDEAEAMDWMNTMIREEIPAKQRMRSSQKRPRSHHNHNRITSSNSIEEVITEGEELEEEVEAQQLLEAELLLNQLTASVDMIMNEYQQNHQIPVKKSGNSSNSTNTNSTSGNRRKNGTSQGKETTRRKPQKSGPSNSTSTTLTINPSEEIAVAEAEDNMNEVSPEHLLEIESLVNGLNNIVAEILNKPSMTTNDINQDSKNAANTKGKAKPTRKPRALKPKATQDNTEVEEEQSDQQNKPKRQRRNVRELLSETEGEQAISSNPKPGRRQPKTRTTTTTNKESTIAPDSTNDSSNEGMMGEDISHLLSELESASTAILSSYQS